MLNVALIGCGRHMRNTLIPYLQRIEDCNITTVVDHDQIALQTALRMTKAQFYADTVEQMDMRNIDAAVVALPPTDTYRAANYLINHGVPCFLEKPPAETTSEVDHLLSIATTRQVYVQIGFNFRFADAVRTITQAIDAAQTPVVSAIITFKSKHPTGPEWGRDDPVAAWLYHNGIHALDLSEQLLGPAQLVRATLTQADWPRFTVVSYAEHSNGSVSVLNMGNVIDRFEVRCEVAAADGTTYFMPNLGEVFMPLRHGGVAGDVLYRASNLDTGWGKTGFGAELQYFMTHCKQCKSGSPSLSQALYASRFCDAILESLREGKAQTLS
jgi:predicted dehydrogenase